MSNWYKELKASETQQSGFWGRGTKISIALFIVGILLCAGLYGAVGTRTITDSSDSIYTQITTSAGGVYQATAANIQLAIYSLNATGGKVTIPNGNYTVGLLISKPNIHLIGSGRTIFSRATTPGDKNNINITASNVTIENIELWGDPDTDTATYGRHCIEIGQYGTEPNVGNIVIRDCYIHDAQNDLIHSYDNTHDVLIEHCVFEDCFNGTIWPAGCFMSGWNVTIRDCSFRNTLACGVVVEGDPLSNDGSFFLIDGNRFSGNITHPIHCEPLNYAKDVIITNNIFCNLTGGLSYSSNVSIRTGGSIGRYVITNNKMYLSQSNYTAIDAEAKTIISDNEMNGYRYAPAVFVHENSIVSSNIMNNFSSGIQVEGNNVTVNGNDINYMVGTSGTIQGSGVYVASKKDCDITDNNIRNTYGIGINVYDGDRTFISGNKFFRTASTHGYHYAAIYLNGGTVNSTITDNFIHHSYNGIVVETLCYSTSILSNVIINCSSYAMAFYTPKATVDSQKIVVGNNVIRNCTSTMYFTANYAKNVTVFNNFGYYTCLLPTSAPTNPIAGNMWVNSTTGFIMYYYGSTATLAHIHVNAS